MNVAAQPLPSNPQQVSSHPLLSARGVIVLERVGVEEQVSNGFGALERASFEKECVAFEEFNRIVPLTIERRGCKSCHAQSDTAPNATWRLATQRFPMPALSGEGEDRALCALFKSRLNFARMGESPLTALPDLAAGGHPDIGLGSNELYNSWQAWMSA